MNTLERIDMGSGSKFQIKVIRGFGLAVYVDRFPHAISIDVVILCFNVYIGIGKGYDQ